MGLFSEWDDSTRANDNVPPLNEPFDYGKQPVRGVNVGGECAPHHLIQDSNNYLKIFFSIKKAGL